MATRIPSVAQPAMRRSYVFARFSNRIGRDSGSTSGRPVVQLGVRLCNRHPVAQPARLRIRAEHIYEW